MTRRELLTLWRARDKRYAIPRRSLLTEEDAASIRAYRLREIALLERDDDRDVAMAVLSQWRLPFTELI